LPLRTAGTLGLIAGCGRLPLAVAEATRKRGLGVAAIGFPGETDPALEALVDALTWLHLGELGRLIEALRGGGVREVVFAGKISKTYLYGDLGRLRLDAHARTLLTRLTDQRDDTILRALASALEEKGIQVRSQAELVPELVASEGTLGGVEPSAAQIKEVAFGWPIAKAVGALDVGQTIVVQKRAVLAVEAIEGTDAAIRRGAALGEPGVTVLKAVKPGQDLRFDLPAVGLDTLAVLAEVKAAVLAVEAHGTLLLDRAALIEQADRVGIALVGIGPGGLKPLDPA